MGWQKKEVEYFVQVKESMNQFGQQTLHNIQTSANLQFYFVEILEIFILCCKKKKNCQWKRS